MLRIQGPRGKDVCDQSLGMTRRDILRVGAAGMAGLSLPQLLQLQAEAATGEAKAKSVIMVYLQGGPSHMDLWDPKEHVPDNVRSAFKSIPTKIPGVQFTEILPKLAEINDRFTMIRSMSYTPNGLFNHTAAIYQMMTGYTTDKVSPSGQLEPPSPKDFPNFGSNIIRLRPSQEPMLPFVMLPRPLQESGVVGKGGTAGFLGKAFDPYTLYPPGDDLKMDKMDNINVDDLKLRPDVFATRLERRALFIHPKTSQRGDLVENLGCALDQWGLVQVDQSMETSVPGVFAAGDTTTLARQLVFAAYQGAMAAVNIHRTLLEGAVVPA